MPDFAAFVLTYGRPDNVITRKALRKAGYDGALYYVVDDEDPTLAEYQRRYGSAVLVFSKAKIAEEFDQGDNSRDFRSVFYARNACWRLARELGVRYFIQLDDDYHDFLYRLAGRKSPEAPVGYHGWQIRSIGLVFEAMVRFIQTTGAAAVAMSQGGDHVGGIHTSAVRLTRKAMNSFVCDAERPFPFRGRVNEDVSTYVSLGNLGYLFFTYWCLQLNQTQTQQSAGGMTELYRASGTYVKSFYSVMYAPSCVVVEYSPAMQRLHHRIAWENAVPKIIPERYRIR